MTIISDSVLMLMLVEYKTVSCWLWTNSGYVCICAFLHSNISLHGIRCTTMTWDMVLCWCWLNKWNGVMSALGEQGVRWYWCMFNVSLLGIRYIIAIAYSSAIQLQWQWYGLGTDVDWIYGTILLCWLLTNSKYVGVGAMPRLQLHTHLIFNYNGNVLRLCADVDVN